MGQDDQTQDRMWSAFRNCSLWRAASDEAVEGLIRTSQLRDYSRGERIFHEGDVLDDFGVVVSGHARGVHYGPEGQPTVFVTLWPGDCIGARHRLGGFPIPFNVEAGEAVEMAILPVQAFTDLLRADPDVALSVIADLSSQLVQLVEMTKSLRLEVPDRLGLYLLRLPRSDVATNSFSVTLPTTRVEIAALLGTTPETLSRSFKELQAGGLLTAEGNIVVVRNEAAMRRRVGM